MSRTLHTQPLTLRAERRLTWPQATRRTDALRLSGRSEIGTSAIKKEVLIVVQRPLPGEHHPLPRQEIRAFAHQLGPQAIYGLKTIRLCRRSALHLDRLILGEYCVPNEVRLYSVPQSPWHLPFLLPEDAQQTMRRYGAQIANDPLRNRSTVTWADADLKQFYVCEVLAHEIGHHLLQHNRGKRPVTICRRRDHERWAENHSRRTALKQKEDND